MTNMVVRDVVTLCRHASATNTFVQSIVCLVCFLNGRNVMRNVQEVFKNDFVKLKNRNMEEKNVHYQWSDATATSRPAPLTASCLTTDLSMCVHAPVDLVPKRKDVQYLLHLSTVEELVCKVLAIRSGLYY